MRRTNKILTTLFFLFAAMTSGSTLAQNTTVTNFEYTILTSLGNTQGIHSAGLDFNEFFTSATLAAKIKADKEGKATRINITKCKAHYLGNSDEKSLNTAKKLLEEKCRNIIASIKSKSDNNKCHISCNAGTVQETEKPRISKEIESIINAHVTNEKRREIHGIDGSHS